MPRPKFNPTEEQRRLVKSLSACGVTQEQIARRLGLRSTKTLRKHFRKVLDEGIADANYNVARTLYDMAISGTHIAATLFWLKCRSGWRERSTTELENIEPPPFIVAKEQGDK
jgi:transposase